MNLQPSLFDSPPVSGRTRSSREASQPHFDGPTYDAEFDHARLTGQMARIYELMADGRWRTLREIEDVTGDPAASVSAQLRHFRKPRFGRHTVERQIRGEREGGLYEYRLIVRT